MNGPDFQYDGLTAFAPITNTATAKKKGLLAAADKASLDKWTNALRARVTRSSSQSIPDNTVTAITFGVEVYDQGNLHDSAANQSRLTVPSGGAGLYLISGGAEWDAASGGTRSLLLRLNGTTNIADVRTNYPTGAAFYQQSLATQYYLADGDYLELTVLQATGAALNVFGVPATHLALARVGN